MRIACPACATMYEVPDGRVAQGQLARCARCGADWMPRGAATELEPRAAPEPDLPAEPEPERAPVAPPDHPLEPASEPESFSQIVRVESRVVESGEPPPARFRPQISALAVAWTLSILILIGAAWATVAARDSVMRAWPASVRGYALLGMARS